VLGRGQAAPKDRCLLYPQKRTLLDVRFVPEAEVAAIRSVELIVQPDAKDAIDEMRVCGDWPPQSHYR
jgi:hypothetical protein